RRRLQIFALLAVRLQAKLLLGKLDLGIYLFNACLRLRDLAPGVLNLKLEFLLCFLRLGLRLGTAKLNFLLFQSRVCLNLGNLRLGLLHLSFSQAHLSRCQIRVLFTFALLSKGLRGLLNELINETIKLTTGTERRKRELDHAAGKLCPAFTSSKQRLNGGARIGKSSQELRPAPLLRHFVGHDGGVGLDLDGERPRLLIAQE